MRPRCAIIGFGLLACQAMLAEAARQDSGLLDTNTLQGGIAVSAEPMSPGPETPGAQRPSIPRPTGREPRGNPLWAISVRSLSATRERPIFLPSRRQPAPAVAGPPPLVPIPAAAPPAPEPRPNLVLVGAITGNSEGIAIFYDEGTREVVRLRTGESYAGWLLRSVRGREAQLQKDQETILFVLPDPGAPPARRNQEL